MGKAILIFVTAFGIMGSLFLANMRDGMAASDQEVADHQHEVLARSAAVAGFERAKQALVEQFNSAPNSIKGTYGGADYVVQVTTGATNARVVSVGSIENAQGDAVTYRVEADVVREMIVPMADEPPPFMQYALLSDDDLYINGEFLTDLDVKGDDDNTLNANVHTNGNLLIKGNSAEISGFGSYVGTASANPVEALQTSFTPNYNPTDSPVVEQSSVVELPTFDVGSFLEKEPADDTTGTFSLSGTHNFGGTRNDPYVWYVAGDLKITGDTQLDGYVMFVVDGDVVINGNVTAGATGYDGPAESSIAIYAGQRVEMQGTPTVRGQILAGTEVAFLYGTPTVYGSVTSLGMLDLRGTPNIYYRPASPALTTVFQDPVEHFRLAAYSEW